MTDNLLDKLVRKLRSMTDELPVETQDFLGELLKRSGQVFGNNQTHQELYQGNLVGMTDIGCGRAKNQDALSVHPINHDKLILAVADGLGCFQFAERAAFLSVSEIPRRILAGETLEQVCQQVHVTLRKFLPYVEKSAEPTTDHGDMGATTLVLAQVSANLLSLATIGDSRGTLIRGQRIIYQSIDQSLANPPHRGLLMNALGARGEYYPLVLQGQPRNLAIGQAVIDKMPLQKNDIVFLATDGFYTNINEADLIQLLQDSDWSALNKILHTTLQKQMTENPLAHLDNYTYLAYRH